MEGYCTFRGMRTWYRVCGELAGDTVPLVVLHGGPGLSSSYVSSLEGLAPERPVVRYDQLGCGRSDRPDDAALWRVETYVEELDALRRELGLDRIHLLGHSWGGQLALEYLLTRPKGVASLVLASSLFSTDVFTDECRRLRRTLPGHVQRTMQRFEDGYRPAVTTSSTPPGPTGAGLAPEAVEKQARWMRRMLPILATPVAQRLAGIASRVPRLRPAANQVAELAFFRRYVCRLPDVPLVLFQDLLRMNRQIFETMWGPSDFVVSGNLSGWDVESRLGELDVPTLITSGQYDHSTPMQNERLRDGIAGSRWEVFETSAHFPHIEEKTRYLEVVGAFLAERS